MRVPATATRPPPAQCPDNKACEAPTIECRQCEQLPLAAPRQAAKRNIRQTLTGTGGGERRVSDTAAKNHLRNWRTLEIHYLGFVFKMIFGQYFILDTRLMNKYIWTPGTERTRSIIHNTANQYGSQRTVHK